MQRYHDQGNLQSLIGACLQLQRVRPWSSWQGVQWQASRQVWAGADIWSISMWEREKGTGAWREFRNLQAQPKRRTFANKVMPPHPSPKSSTNQGQSIQIYEPIWGIFIQTTTIMNFLRRIRLCNYTQLSPVPTALIQLILNSKLFERMTRNHACFYGIGSSNGRVLALA